jgi:hypothetical protein
MLSSTEPYRTASKYPAKPCITPACGMWNVSVVLRTLCELVRGKPVILIRDNMEGRYEPRKTNTHTSRIKHNVPAGMLEFPAVLDLRAAASAHAAAVSG